MGMISQCWMISGEGQHIPDTQNPGPQQIRLERQPVSIPAGHLEDWINALIFQEMTYCHGAQSQDRTLQVGDIDSIHPIFYKVCILYCFLYINTFNGSYLCGNNKLFCM